MTQIVATYVTLAIFLGITVGALTIGAGLPLFLFIGVCVLLCGRLMHLHAARALREPWER
jgi:hypothetical protein